jgi:SAM-dependent methyltransferase
LPEDPAPLEPTQVPEYAERLAKLEETWWRRVLPVQLPYRYNLRRLRLGRTLEVGCGIGRNLRHLHPDAVGIDHSSQMVAVCRERGLSAYTTDAFRGSESNPLGSFDSLLFAHILEHMTIDEAGALVEHYLPYVRSGGKVVLITPQERGFRSDATHRTFLDDRRLDELATERGLAVAKQYSWPLPRCFGSVFPYNEFVLVATRAATPLAPSSGDVDVRRRSIRPPFRPPSS